MSLVTRARIIEITASGLNPNKPHRLNKLKKLGPLPTAAASEPVEVAEAAAPPPPVPNPHRSGATSGASRRKGGSAAAKTEDKVEDKNEE
jgi:hypothetical protein